MPKNANAKSNAQIHLNSLDPEYLFWTIASIVCWESFFVSELNKYNYIYIYVIDIYI